MKNEEIYMRRLARYSLKELSSLQKFVASRKGQLRFAGMMLRCITAAMLIKVELQPA